ncbi:MAG: hypothetical protein RJA23_1651 [Bacteroidota bacterium]|jgi:hypothetical protein
MRPTKERLQEGRKVFQFSFFLTKRYERIVAVDESIRAKK